MIIKMISFRIKLLTYEQTEVTHVDRTDFNNIKNINNVTITKYALYLKNSNTLPLKIHLSASLTMQNLCAEILITTLISLHATLNKSPCNTQAHSSKGNILY